MRQPVPPRARALIITTALALTVVATVALYALWMRPAARVSLVLTGYKQWPGDSIVYAEFQLINNTTNNIFYPILRDSGPITAPALFRESTPAGWTAPQRAPYSRNGQFTMHPLMPGKTAHLVVPLATGAPAKKIGIECADIPRHRQSPIVLWLRRLITPRAVLQINDQQIWCDDGIVVPTTGTSSRCWSCSRHSTTFSPENRMARGVPGKPWQSWLAIAH